MTKSQAYYATNNPDRKAWAASMKQCCMSCELLVRKKCDYGTRLQIHEIEQRSAAPKSWMHRCNFLLLCQRCHDNLHCLPGPVKHRLGLKMKLKHDRLHFDLAAWHSLRPRPLTYLTMNEILAP